MSVGGYRIRGRGNGLISLGKVNSTVMDEWGSWNRKIEWERKWGERIMGRNIVKDS